MAFNVNFYNFRKEVNSTAVPEPVAGDTQKVVYQCEARDPLSLAAPVIKVLIPMAANINFNYMYVGAFNRYYWITDWEYRDRCWWVSGRVDPLATYRYDIGEISAYVLRSAHEYDGTVQDNLYPVKAQWSGNIVDYASPWVQNPAAGLYSIGIIGSGKTQFYLTDNAELNNMLSYMLSDQYASDALTALGVTAYPEAKAILDPLQYISCITYLPISNTYFDLDDFIRHEIKIGYVTYHLVAWSISNAQPMSFPVTMSVPRHPSAAARGAYMNNAPYSSYDVYFPPFGLIALDPALCANAASITATAYVDLHTGLSSLLITNNSGRVMSRTSGKVGYSMQLSQVIAQGYGIMSAAKDAAGILSGIEGGIPGLISSGISSIANGIGNAITGNIPSANSIGSVGSVDAMQGPVQMQTMYAMPVEDDLAHRGRPLCAVRTIRNVPGYLMCADVDIHILGATSTEMDMIKSYMESGFFYA